jgi:protein-arginine kinase activator protein McsA
MKGGKMGNIKKFLNTRKDKVHSEASNSPLISQLSRGLPVGLPDNDSKDNFTPRAKQVLALSRKEADRFNHNFVGTEHLLIGLVKLGQGVAVNVLQKLGLDLETVRMEVERQVGTGPDQRMVGNIPYTPRLKKVLALAAKESKALNHTYVGTEHILLGLLREGDGVAARVLKNLDVDIELTRQEILKELDPNFAGLEENPSNNSSSSSEFETQFRSHPLVQTYLELLAGIKQQKERALKNKDFEGAAIMRDKEKSAKEKLTALYDRLRKDPTFGTYSEETFIHFCSPIQWPLSTCVRVELAAQAATSLSQGKSVVLVGREGSGRRTLSGFISKELFEISAKSHLAGTRLMLLNHTALAKAGERDGYTDSLLGFFDRIVETGALILTVPRLDECCSTDVCHEKIVNAWKLLVTASIDRGSPILTWTDQEVGWLHLQKMWPGFVDNAAVLHLPDLGDDKIELLIRESLKTLSDSGKIEFDADCIAALLAARESWRKFCDIAEPGLSLELLNKLLSEESTWIGGMQLQSRIEQANVEIGSAKRRLNHLIAIGDFEKARKTMDQIEKLTTSDVNEPVPMPIRKITRETVNRFIENLNGNAR